MHWSGLVLATLATPRLELFGIRKEVGTLRFTGGAAPARMRPVGLIPERSMKTAVLIEKLATKRYRASTAQPIALQTVGRTRDEAVQRLCALARKRLSAGEWLQVSLPGPPQANPWIAYAGIWKDHPDIDDFVKNIAAYRRAGNGDPSA